MEENSIALVCRSWLRIVVMTSPISTVHRAFFDRYATNLVSPTAGCDLPRFGTGRGGPDLRLVG